MSAKTAGRIDAPRRVFDIGDYIETMFAAAKAVAAFRFNANLIYSRAQAINSLRGDQVVAIGLTNLQTSLTFA